MSNGSKIFDCCVQCQIFWECKPNLESIEKEDRTHCCPSCGNFEVCKIIIDKIKVKQEASPNKSS